MAWIKLCVDPPSIKIVTRCWLRKPKIFNLVGANWTVKAWKEILGWASVTSEDTKSGSGSGSGVFGSSDRV